MSTQDTEDQLMELLLQWEDLRAAGQDRSVEDLCKDFPDLACELSRRIRVLLEFEPPSDREAHGCINGVDRISKSCYRPQASLSQAPPSRYRRLRPHAKGGLGKVFVARDEELNREVALKEILSEFAQDPVSRSRFLSEAEITGGLEHPGIVPVYGMGSCHDGRPFYAMRFVRGNTLKDAIDEFHTADAFQRDPGARSLALRALLRRLIDVCNTVAYAHSRGVLHRDLKPSNVMLGPYGETLVVDWGLAKRFDRPDAPGDDEECSLSPSLAGDVAASKTGTISGTPAYMSPEQAQGRTRDIGPATDVYGLGATLYTILTGKAPFAGKSLHLILSKIKEGHFTRPRASSASIPRPLEAVCLKAMALRPEDRYDSARTLADELELWLADQPVSAWREPLLERARRLMRRHRVWFLAAAVTLLTVSLSLGVSLAIVSAKNVALGRERLRAEANASFVLQGLTETLKRLANPALMKDPECRESVLAALKEGEAIYLDVMDSERRFWGAPSPMSQYWIHVALLRTAGGDREGTLEAYNRALNDAKAEMVGHPDDAYRQAAIAWVRTHLGLELWVRGAHREARDQLKLADNDFRRALDAKPDISYTQRMAAWLHVFCPDRQIRDERLALDLSYRVLKEANGRQTDRARFSAGIRPLLTLALAQYRTGDWKGARSTIEESIRRKAAQRGDTTLEKLVETRSVIDAYDWFVWSLALARLGETGPARQRFEDATQWMRRNRYGDFELHLLHDEAESVLGQSAGSP